MHASIPLEYATTPKDVGVTRNGKFYTTTERVFRNNRLVLGQGDTVPWERAVELGLVESDDPVIETPEVEPPHEMPPREENGEHVPELVADPDITATIVRRKRKNPNGGLRAS